MQILRLLFSLLKQPLLLLNIRLRNLIPQP